MKNIIKGIITSLLGFLIIFVTLIMVFIGNAAWVWEGIAGITLGVILLFAPDTLIKNFVELIGKFTKKEK